MANKHKGEVEIQLGNRTVDMKFSFNAIAELEELNDNISVGALFSEDEKIGFRLLRDAVYCATKHNFRNLTREKTGELLESTIDSMEDFQELSMKVGQALSLAMGDNGDNEELVPVEDEVAEEKN